MAEFCLQCANDTWQINVSDFKGIAPSGGLARVLCEGCGYCVVDEKGKCLSADCFKRHNAPSSLSHSRN